ncbi:MAG: DUF3048 domain-containing protein, partial [Candidatus Saccharimonadales bacterium]
DGQQSDSGQKFAWLHRIREWWNKLSKKKRIVLIVASLLVLGLGSGSAAYFIVHNKKPKATAIAAPKKTVKKAPVDTRVPSTLSGLLVDPTVNQRPVTGIMIENSTDARPQSGLGDASVVFEAIAEGGITRFLTLFQDTQPDYIGPVRSVRPYYEQWALGFDAPLAHVGGSPEALANIKTWGVKDLDQFYNSGAYQRVSNRYAPHNVYTSIAKLNEIEAAKGYLSSTFTGFTRKKEAPYKAPAAATSTTKTKTTTKPDTRTVANAIDVAISSALYNNHYDYDTATNSYKRSEGGQPHMVVDVTGAQKQITPKVIITLVMPYGIQSDGKHSEYGTIGTGQMFVFQDGTVTPGTWTKSANNEQFQFVDNEGHPLPLNPGQTWLTVVDAAGDVTYK